MTWNYIGFHCLRSRQHFHLSSNIYRFFIAMRRRHSQDAQREPSKVEAWLVGSGIASLAAAVHLIMDAKVPGSRIHVLDVRPASGGGMRSGGDPATGYVVYSGRQPYYNGCMGKLLSLVRDPANSSKTLLESIREQTADSRPHKGPSTRFIGPTSHGPQVVSPKGMPISLKHRLALMKIIITGETALGKGKISDFLDKKFFDTDFWLLWSTT
jgi:oleate hydratase